MKSKELSGDLRKKEAQIWRKLLNCGQVIKGTRKYDSICGQEVKGITANLRTEFPSKMIARTKSKPVR